MNYILTGVISVFISVITTLVIASNRDYAGGNYDRKFDRYILEAVEDIKAALEEFHAKVDLLFVLLCLRTP